MAVKEQLTVIYRQDSDGDVTAFFPTEDAGDGFITCYMHVGQHSAAAPELVAEMSVATPEQYADLHSELCQIYDDCKLVVAA